MRVYPFFFLPFLLSVVTYMVGQTGSGGMRRSLIILTLGTILWTVYQVLKEPAVSVKKISIVAFVAAVSLSLIAAVLKETGW